MLFLPSCLYCTDQQRLSAGTKRGWNVQAVFAMLACARLGAPHSVVFGGFAGWLGGNDQKKGSNPSRSSCAVLRPELATRLEDFQPKASPHTRLLPSRGRYWTFSPWEGHHLGFLWAGAQRTQTSHRYSSAPFARSPSARTGGVSAYDQGGFGAGGDHSFGRMTATAFC